MLGDNIKALRKNKGYSQETLAGRLNVVRQTVSKWEKGLSVPDAEMLGQIADLFEIPVSDLLGGDIPEKEGDEQNALALQLAILNEQFAGEAVRRRRRVKRTLIGIAIAVVLAAAVFALLCGTSYSPFSPAEPSFADVHLLTAELVCSAGEDGHIYTIVFSAHNNAVVYTEVSVNAWTPYDLTTGLHDAYDMIYEIEHHFVDNGGKCRMTITEGASR